VIPPLDISPWPPRATHERTTLVGFLESFRSVLLRKAVGLGPSQLDTRVGVSTLTIGGLLKHMAFVEDHWFHHVLLGNDYPDPWASVDWSASPDWEFDSARDDAPDALLAQFETSVGRSRTALASAPDLDAPAAKESGGEATSLRWILVHMIEEYARHCGHADLIRESIDGVTGD